MAETILLIFLGVQRALSELMEGTRFKNHEENIL